MGYETEYALAIRSEVVDEFWRRVKENAVLAEVFRYATVSRDDEGNICLSDSGVKWWTDIRNELTDVLLALDEIEDDAYEYVTIGDEWGDYDYGGSFQQHEFNIHAQRKINVEHKTPIEFPTGVTIMREAVEDGGERDDR